MKQTVKSVVKYFLRPKWAMFYSFDKNNIKSNAYALVDKAEFNLFLKYDYFITGSDQVWNPHYNFIGTSDLLAFAKPEQRISYSASFGVDEIPDEKKKEYTENLSQFMALSVREKRGAEIIKELTGKDAQVVLDPTMLLTSDQWSKVEKSPSLHLKSNMHWCILLEKKVLILKMQ